MIETSLVNLREAIDYNITLHKGMKVILPIGDTAIIYGFITIDCGVLGGYIDMPPLGEATVLSNRVVFKTNNELHRFPIFNSVTSSSKDKYELRYLYVPKLLHLQYQSHVTAYIQSMTCDEPHYNVGKIENVILEEGVAYYRPMINDLYFQSASKLRGIGIDFAVITRRVSKLNDDIKYEIFSSTEVMIEKDEN